MSDVELRFFSASKARAFGPNPVETLNATYFGEAHSHETKKNLKSSHSESKALEALTNLCLSEAPLSSLKFLRLQILGSQTLNTS